MVTTNGALAGNVTVTTGGLELDKPTALSPSAILSVVSTLASGAVNLNFNGTQVVSALFIDGSPAASGTWGSPASSAQNTSPIFGGTGIINILGPPLVVQQPLPVGRFPGYSATFSVGIGGAAPFTYQWKFNGNNIANATDSSYNIAAVATSDAGTYSCAITNAFGSTNTANVALTVLTTNYYVNAILADNPISYWRLNETNGTVTLDEVSTNNGKYVNVGLNKPGYSQTDSDPAISLGTNASGHAFVQSPTSRRSPFRA